MNLNTCLVSFEEFSKNNGYNFAIMKNYKLLANNLKISEAFRFAFKERKGFDDVELFSINEEKKIIIIVIK